MQSYNKSEESWKVKSILTTLRCLDGKTLIWTSYSNFEVDDEL